MNIELEKKLRNVRIMSERPIKSPELLRQELPVSDDIGQKVVGAREQIVDILNGKDKRIMVFAGPCSIHDVDAGIEYARKFVRLAKKVDDRMLLVMRTYFEKPRSITGWKGLVRDPEIDGKDNVNLGLYLSRKFLIDVISLGLPTTMEVLGDRSIQYMDELVCHGTIGARTVESQPQREVASGLSFPIGMKNGTNGDICAAVQAVESVMHGHDFVGMDNSGIIRQYTTGGNPDAHVVLRGKSPNGDLCYKPNYDTESIANAVRKLEDNSLPTGIVVDCSHGNSEKDYRKQPDVFMNVMRQMAVPNYHIKGAMLESNINQGSQNLPKQLGPDSKKAIDPYVSVTDACIGWDTTEKIILEAYKVLEAR